jgi:anti-sigma B factor antagonist
VQLRIQERGPSTLALAGDIDMASEDTFRSSLEGQPAGDELTLDMSEVTFMDSTGLGILLGAAAARAESAPLVLLHPSTAVTRVLELAGIGDQIAGMHVRARPAG